MLILPYTVWTLRGFIAGIPRELDEAALIDGCSRFQVFWRIILPLTGPGLVATSVYGFIQAWNEFIIINTLNDQEQQNLMAWLLQNQTQPRDRLGPAHGRGDHDLHPGGDLLPDHPAQHRDRPDGRRRQGLTRPRITHLRRDDD